MAPIVKERPAKSQLMALLAKKSCFAEALMAPQGAPLRLDPWQAHFLDNDKGKVTTILKSRRVGGSFAMAAKMFIRSQTKPGYQGTFVSMNREEARGKIDYADELHDALPQKWRLSKVARSRDEIAFTDNHGGRSAIKSLAAKAPRGRGGDVGISELPHCQNASSIYEGALHVTARDVDDRLTVESTPLGKGGIFYDLTSGKFPGVVRYEIPWWLSSALCSDIDTTSQRAPIMPTKERVEKFGTDSMKAIYAAMPQNAFRQESELAFIEMEDTAFPYELLSSCAQPDFSVYEGVLRFLHLEKPPTQKEWAWLRSNRKGKLFAGFDPGRKKDPAAFIILDYVDGRYEARMSVSVRNESFSRQREIIEGALFCGVQKIGIDATGIGMEISERLQKDYPDKVLGITFTARKKASLVTHSLNVFTEKKIVIPQERSFISELASIRESVSPSGALLYHAPRTANGHGDRAWALFMAVEAASGQTEINRMPQYESLAKRQKGAWNDSASLKKGK